MKIVYMGTPAFAVPALELLAEKHEVVLVLTQPDKPAGRGNKVTAGPVKEAAEKLGLPVLQPPTLKLEQAKNIRKEIKSYNADVFIVAAYGILLPKGVLNMPKHGCLNIHASLLPKYRGASPIQAALLNGDTTTGITIMRMERGLDTGDMLLHKSLDIHEDERLPALHDRLKLLGAEAVLETLELIKSGKATYTPQRSEESSYAPLIKKTDGEISWACTSREIFNKLRAYDPWPGIFTNSNNPLKIRDMEIIEHSGNESPGTILDISKGITVKTGNGAIIITSVQAQNGKKMPAKDFLRGHRVNVGESLT